MNEMETALAEGRQRARIAENPGMELLLSRPTGEDGGVVTLIKMGTSKKVLSSEWRAESWHLEVLMVAHQLIDNMIELAQKSIVEQALQAGREQRKAEAKVRASVTAEVDALIEKAKNEGGQES